MSTYDDASLILIPSGVKDGKVYSAKPTNGDGDFTFTRASEATRLVDGVVTKVRTNSLLQSNDFDTTWATFDTTLTSGQADKDGGTDAWLVTKSAASGRIGQASLTGTGVISYSLYVKANASDWVLMKLMQAGNDPYAYFDVSTGAVGTTYEVADTSITSVGNGWYRCTLSAEMAGLTSVRTYPAELDGDVSGTTGSIYIQNAQLENGTVATDYIATTTVAVSEGPVANMPRLNSVAGGCPSLLLEGQRSNLVPYSEDISQWSLTAATLTSNDAISPDGYQNAGKIVTSSAGVDVKYTSVTVVASTTYTASFWVKLTSGTGLQTRFYDNTNSANIEYYTYDSQLTIGEWSRVTRTFTTPAGCTNIQVWYLATSTSSSVTAHFWGYQLEAGSYATSYIPNYGTTAGVTRVGDWVSTKDITSLSIGNSYTLFFEIDIAVEDNNKVFYALYNSVSSNTFTVRNVVGGVRAYNNLDLAYPISAKTSSNGKYVMRVDGTAYSLFYLNSGVPANDGGTLATARDFGYLDFGGTNTSWSFSQHLIFPTALTDTECNALIL